MPSHALLSEPTEPTQCFYPPIAATGKSTAGGAVAGDADGEIDDTLMKIAVITPVLDDWPAFGGAGAAGIRTGGTGGVV